MRNFKRRNTVDTYLDPASPEYLKGYQDGVRDRRATHRGSGDGILGALLAIALMAGVGYFGYNYATTGRLLPEGLDTTPVLPQSSPSRP